MTVLGIETSCDECSAAVVRDGKHILSNVVASQVERHAPWNGVVPEIASRLHVEWIDEVMGRALGQAGVSLDRSIDALAVTARPGLVGSLLVGLSYAKGLAWSVKKPWVGIDHLLAHVFSALVEHEVSFPFLSLVVSGGHTILCRVDAFDRVSVLGKTIDDACGEVFDKVARHHGMGYPGGVALDRLAESGDAEAFAFPVPRLHKGNHRYDVSYSGLKTAAVLQLDQFHREGHSSSLEDVAASFRKAAVDILVERVDRAAGDTGIRRLTLGGGVSANSYLRRVLGGRGDLDVYIPSLPLCTDNGAMIAALGYHRIKAGHRSDFSLNAAAQVAEFRHAYP